MIGVNSHQGVMDLEEHCQASELAEALLAWLLLVYIRHADTIAECRIPVTMLTRAIARATWGSEVMLAGFPTIAFRRLNVIASRLRIGDCIDASILLAKDCPRWFSSALKFGRLTKIPDIQSSIENLCDFVLFLVLPAPLMDSFVATGTLQLNVFPLQQLNCALSIEAAIKKTCHWMAQGLLDDFLESPVTLAAWRPWKANVTAEMKVASGRGGQQHSLA